MDRPAMNTDSQPTDWARADWSTAMTRLPRPRSSRWPRSSTGAGGLSWTF